MKWHSANKISKTIGGQSRWYLLDSYVTVTQFGPQKTAYIELACARAVDETVSIAVFDSVINVILS